jgi:hypothetical protein
LINLHLNQSIKSLLILSAFVLLLSLAVYLSGNHQGAVISARQCQLTESLSCRFALANSDNEQVIVNFSANVQVEEQNALQLILPERFRITDIWIQGVNMYMGKVAVISQTKYSQHMQNDQEFMFFIGACSEPNMRWQLIIELENRTSHKTERFFVNFNTKLI